MGLHHNPLTDEVGMENYLALYLSIKGIVPKGETKRVYSNAKDALKLMEIKTTELDETETKTNKGKKKK